MIQQGMALIGKGTPTPDDVHIPLQQIGDLMREVLERLARMEAEVKVIRENLDSRPSLGRPKRAS